MVGIKVGIHVGMTVGVVDGTHVGVFGKDVTAEGEGWNCCRDVCRESAWSSTRYSRWHS